MNRFKVGATVLCLAVVALAYPVRTKADEWNKKTTVTFSAPVEIPGVGAQVLPAGTYVFKLVDSSFDRHIVRIFNEAGDHVYATILAIPNYRLKATDKTVMTFRERAAGEPEAIRAWFYPGNEWGQEFVYPKKRALELAKITNVPVLAMPTELETNLTTPVASVDEPPAVALKEAPIEAVKPTGEVVPVAEVVEAPPVQAAPVVEQAATVAPPKEDAKSFPLTASFLPLMGLIGVVSLLAGFTLLGFSKRSV